MRLTKNNNFILHALPYLFYVSLHKKTGKKFSKQVNDPQSNSMVVNQWLLGQCMFIGLYFGQNRSIIRDLEQIPFD